METNHEINTWAAAAVTRLIARCIEQAEEELAWFKLMWGDFE